MRIVQRKLCAEVQNAASRAGFSDIQAKIIAGRLGAEDAARVDDLMHPSLRLLTPPSLLPDIDIASNAIALAIASARPIVVISDYDCDGASAHAVLKIALEEYFDAPGSLVQSIMGHRLKDGYGITSSLTRRVVGEAQKGALVITADHGTSNGEQIDSLREAGIETIVTDHHGVPLQGPPKAALACVNPVRADSRFPDRYVAGVHVAWLLCCAVRQKLEEAGRLPQKSPKLGGLLDLVALGTVADCVDLGRSVNNRAVIRQGLRIMNSEAPRHAWRAMVSAASREFPIESDTIAYTFGPMINSSGRLASALGSVELLTSKSGHQCERLASELMVLNAERRAIQREMLFRAVPFAERLAGIGVPAISLLDEQGHMGVQGICASRLVELFGRPVAFFCPRGEDDLISGSLRSSHNLNVREALEEIAESIPGEVRSWGGHPGAGGITLHRSAFTRFKDKFAKIAGRSISAEQLGPRVVTDGELPCAPTLKVLDELDMLQPYGRGWEGPVFQCLARIVELRAVGDGSHLKLLLEIGSAKYDAIWFGAVHRGRMPIQRDQKVKCAYSLERNAFRGNVRLQLRVHSCLAISG